MSPFDTPLRKYEIAPSDNEQDDEELSESDQEIPIQNAIVADLLEIEQLASNNLVNSTITAQIHISPFQEEFALNEEEEDIPPINAEQQPVLYNDNELPENDQPSTGPQNQAPISLFSNGRFSVLVEEENHSFTAEEHQQEFQFLQENIAQLQPIPDVRFNGLFDPVADDEEWDVVISETDSDENGDADDEDEDIIVSVLNRH